MTDAIVPTFQPPAGFIAVESRLAGITVYAPAPAEQTGPEARTFQCPQCGAATAYDPAAESVTCASCGFEQSLAARVVGRAAEVAEFTVETLQREARGWGGVRRELHCEACGANLSLAPGELSTTCPFCASNRVVATPANDAALRPRFLIPFKVQPDACLRVARDWLGRGWMHPAGLANVAASTCFTGIYLPFWTFSARLGCEWHAEVGYERAERYYDAGSKEWKTRTTIDWRWESGDVTVPITDHLTSGTSKVNRTLLERTQPYDLNALADYDPGYLAGWQAQGYDVPLPEAWEQARAAMRETAKAACRGDIHSAHVRNLSITVAFDEESWRYVLLPVYVAAYRYGGKAYQIMINGQTGAVAGGKPVAWHKVWLAAAALVAPGSVIALAGLPLLLAGGIGVVPLIVGGVLFAVGGAAAGYILWQAYQSEQER